ncbi:MAG: hypothetical protein IJ410_02350 [Oscillospiraceae bacterium]|nr:hypothetical protein [Oscillospiraceae bacterium]
MTWTPMMCFAVIAFAFVIGEFLSRLTKGYVSSMVFGCFVAMGLFWSGLIPATIAMDSTLLPTLYGVGVAMLLVNMGTSIDIESLIQEWKTVVVCCAGLVGIGVLAFTIGNAVFGKEYSLVAAPVVAGGVIAYQIVADAAVTAGQPLYAGFAALVLAFQSMIGMPVASFCLKKELISAHAKGMFSGSAEKKTAFKLPETNLFKDPSPAADTPTLKFFKLAVVATVGYCLTTYVVPAINVNIMYLLVGIVARKINFLQREPLKAAGGYGYIMLCMYALTFNGFATVSPTDALGFIFPLFGTLILGVIGIAIMALIFGKIVGYNPYVSIACGVTALFGYPATEILSNEVVASMTDFTAEEKEKALSYVLPKMVVGGFTTVTIASVVFAGIIAPMIF